MESSEIELVRQVWGAVTPKRFHHGTEILAKLFEENPSVQARFPNLKEIPLDVARKNTRFRAHASRITGSLDSIISMLEDEDMLRETIYLLADTHNRFETSLAEFEIFKSTMMSYLHDTLGDNLSSEQAAAFDKLLTVFNSILGEFLER